MEEFKGTPGPWVASDSDRSIGPVCKDDDQSYGMLLPVAWVEFDGKPGHHQANANLIAAAPELLKVVIGIVAGWESKAGIRYEDIIDARAAIAKALGETK